MGLEPHKERASKEPVYILRRISIHILLCSRSLLLARAQSLVKLELSAGHKTNAQFWRTRVTMALASFPSELALARVSGDGDSDRLGNDCLHGNLTRWTLDDGPTNNVDKWLHTQSKRCRALACK